MGVGELCNFAAYGFVPATLVTPLGALSVLISAILAAYFLNEKLNRIGKIGCFLTAIGSTVMVIHAPKDGDVKSVRDLLEKATETEFVLFTLISIIGVLILIFVFSPRYGTKNILCYIMICSMLGSFTVMSCKALSLGIKEIINKKPSVSLFYTYLFAFILIVCVLVQMNYLNKALDVFNTAIVTTVYYVLFTMFVMISSSVLFKELLSLSFEDFVGCLCGFSTICCALCLIHFFKTTQDPDFHILTSLPALDKSSTNNYDEESLKDLSSFNDSSSHNSSSIVDTSSINTTSFNEPKEIKNHNNKLSTHSSSGNMHSTHQGSTLGPSRPLGQLSNQKDAVFKNKPTLTSPITPKMLLQKLTNPDFKSPLNAATGFLKQFQSNRYKLLNNSAADDEDSMEINEFEHQNSSSTSNNFVYKIRNDADTESLYSKIVKKNNVNNRYAAAGSRTRKDNQLFNVEDSDEEEENLHETSLSGSSLLTIRS